MGGRWATRKVDGHGLLRIGSRLPATEWRFRPKQNGNGRHAVRRLSSRKFRVKAIRANRAFPLVPQGFFAHQQATGRMHEHPLDIYIVAIGGTGMAPLACLLQDLGHRVHGVDGPLYPPMSTLLDEAGIVPLVGYDARHLANDGPGAPDLVVLGNAVPRTNPEAQAAERLRDVAGVPILSMPETLSRFLLADRKPLVAAGTHGKTTTSSMAAWTLERCGSQPGWLVGGIPRNLERSFAVGRGTRFVVEGDEYNAAYFDRGPKFLHYQPHTLILTSVEYDHADLYATHESLLTRYRELVKLVPADGLVIACGEAPDQDDTPSAAALSTEVARAAEDEVRVVSYGLDSSCDVYPLDLETDADGSRFRVGVSGVLASALDLSSGDAVVHLKVAGEHNLLNALAVWTAARFDGLAAPEVAAALSEFDGAKRRLEELDTVQGVTVVDDFAHHPTAVAKSTEGLRQRYPGRRIVLCFEPRSLSAGRALFDDAYRRAFSATDVVYFAPLAHAERLRREGHEVLDLKTLVADLRADGIEAHTTESTEDLLRRVIADARAGDVVATMSSGSFDGLPSQLVEMLAERTTP